MPHASHGSQQLRSQPIENSNRNSDRYAAHRPTLLHCAAAELDALAEALQALTRGYDALFERPFPYVMAVHQAPTDTGSERAGHLHVELYPPLRTAHKLKYLAGSEQGGGVFIVDTLPEESAAALREAVGRAAS